MDPPLIQASKAFHQLLFNSCLSVDKNGIPNTADKSQTSSQAITSRMVSLLVLTAQSNYPI
jgi:hypothetical protein